MCLEIPEACVCKWGNPVRYSWSFTDLILHILGIGIQRVHRIRSLKPWERLSKGAGEHRQLQATWVLPL